MTILSYFLIQLNFENASHNFGVHLFFFFTNEVFFFNVLLLTTVGGLWGCGRSGTKGLAQRNLYPTSLLNERARL